jgi:hypothetical protein
MNYTELTDTVIGYSDRADLLDTLALFTKVVESRLNRLIKLENDNVKQVYTAVAADGIYDLPVDFSSATSVVAYPKLSTKSRIQHALYSTEQFDDLVTDGSTTLKAYCINGSKLHIYPVLNDNYTVELVYNRKIVPLTPQDQDNWLVNNFPDVYVFGLMAEVSAFVKDAAAATMWDERFKTACEEVNFNQDKFRHSGIAIQTRVG